MENLTLHGAFVWVRVTQGICALLQAGQLAGKVRELEAKLAAAQQQTGQLSAAIEQEQRKIRFFFGQDLEQLGWENLQELEQFHHRSLARLLPRLVGSASSVVGSSVD